MTKTFVALNDPVHNLIRNVTRHTPLWGGLSRDPRLLVQYRFETGDLPEAYYALGLYHALGGCPIAGMPWTRWRARASVKGEIAVRAGFFDVVRLDRRCARDLRLKLKRHGPGLLAGELLCFGVGALRARNDDPCERIHQYLWSQYGRLHSRYEIVYARIMALHRNSQPLIYWRQKESFDSTNMIYGDALGEVEQLWDRRADTAFLGEVAEALQRMHRQAEVGAFLQPPLNLAAVLKLHLRSQQLWKRPPPTARALLRRIEYILSRTTVDGAPTTIFRRQGPQRESQRGLRAGSSQDWNSDRSGYDGWLAGSGDDAGAPK